MPKVLNEDITRLKPVTFIVALTIDATWIADGFAPDDERMHDILWKALGSATHDECSAKVLATSCGPQTIFNKYQGFTGKALGAEVGAYKKATPYRVPFYHFKEALEGPAKKT